MTLEQTFSGAWRASRKLNGEPFFSGNATFTAAGNNDLILYREEGFADHPGGFSALAFREYYFAISPGAFRIYFDQEQRSLFNSVQLFSRDGCYVGSGLHYCGQDTYESEYSFHNKDLWVWNHKVSGPKKEYLLETEYRR